MNHTRSEPGPLSPAVRCGATAGLWAAFWLLALAPAATAQCAYWRSLPPYVYADVAALAVFDDDGDGPHAPELVVGGTLGAIGGGPQRYIGKWNGTAWSELAQGTTGVVSSFLVFDDDGPGPILPALYAGGSFYLPSRGIARWNGASWSPLGEGTAGTVHALCAFDDDGPGPRPSGLYAGGRFDSIGSAPIRNIAMWDGAQWFPLSLGVSGGFGYVSAMAVFDDDGVGPRLPALYVGGSFTFAGVTPAPGIARWDGFSWSTVGVGINGIVFALCVFDDDGPGPHPEALYAAGMFGLAGTTPASNIARWDGAQWEAVGEGLNNTVRALFLYDDGGPAPHAPQLFAGGEFSLGGGPGTGRIAKWDGQAWLPLGAGVTGQVVHALAAYDDDHGGPTPLSLYVGGLFWKAGDVDVAALARYRELVSVAILAQPASGPRVEGDPTTLTVEAEGEVLSYQWRRNGEPLVDQAPYSGVRTPTLLIDSFAQNTEADYDCVVTDPCGSLATDTAALTVEAYCPMDVNGDGVTNFLDLNLLLSFYGETCPPRP